MLKLLLSRPLLLRHHVAGNSHVMQRSSHGCFGMHDTTTWSAVVDPRRRLRPFKGRKVGEFARRFDAGFAAADVDGI